MFFHGNLLNPRQHRRMFSDSVVHILKNSKERKEVIHQLLCLGSVAIQRVECYLRAQA